MKCPNCGREVGNEFWHRDLHLNSDVDYFCEPPKQWQPGDPDRRKGVAENEVKKALSLALIISRYSRPKVSATKLFIDKLIELGVPIEEGK